MKLERDQSIFIMSYWVQMLQMIYDRRRNNKWIWKLFNWPSCHKIAYLRNSILLHSKCLKTEREPESIFYVYQKRISEERNWSGHVYSTTQTTLSYLIPAGVYIKWPLTQTKAGRLLGNRVKRRLERWRWERGWEKSNYINLQEERQLKVKKLSLFFLVSDFSDS